MKIVQTLKDLGDCTALTKEKNFLLLVSEEELKAVEEILKKSELTWQEEYGERRSRQRRILKLERRYGPQERRRTGQKGANLIGRRAYSNRRSS